MKPEILSRIKVVQGDITELDAEALVTAANSGLRGGGGVDGAIHRAAGPKLVQASMALAPCPAGSARITDAFDLPNQYVIHAVGPIYQGATDDAQRLADAYHASLELARDHQVRSIAFPCISTGIYGYPSDQACEIAVDAVANWLSKNELPQIVIFCCFNSGDFTRYQSRLSS